MTRGSKAVLLGTATSLFLFGSAAQAQNTSQGLSEEEVRSFFDTMQQDMTEAVEAGDFERLVEWSQDSVAEEATFTVSNEVYRGDERKSISIVTLDKEDMMRLGQAAAGMMSGMQGQPVQDYSLEIEITDFTPIGTDAANVTAEFTESGTLAVQPPQTADAGQPDETVQTGSVETDGQQAGSGEEITQMAGGQSLRIEATAQCNHVVHRGETEDQLVIGLSTCQARTDFQPSSG